MLSNNVGGMPGLDQLLQEALRYQFVEQEERVETMPIIRTVEWLHDDPQDEALGTSKADHDGAPPETDAWTCPRCRSHRCVRTNPGDISDAVFSCAVCGYTFHAASASRLRDPPE